MIYGSKEYGAGSSDCSRCEAHSANLTIVECFVCGARGCDRCLSLRVSDMDVQTGYHDEHYICSACDGDLQAKAAEMHAEEEVLALDYVGWRAEALQRCADLRESLRQAEGAD